MDVDDIAFSCSLFSDKVDNTDGLNQQLQMDAFGYMVQGSFLTYMYSVGRHRAAAEIERESLPYCSASCTIGLFIDLFANASSVDSYENH